MAYERDFMKYPYILLDADGTLFDFHRGEREALARLLPMFGAPDTADAVEDYRRINEEYWRKFEKGLVDKSTLLVQRFRDFYSALGVEVDCQAVNAAYLEILSGYHYLIPGALQLCRRLKNKGHSLYIVTNGTLSAQGDRYRESGLAPYLDGVFISDEIGVAKPETGFFDHVFSAIGNPPKSQVIILGDSLGSDIRGGRAAGIATCFFSPDGAPMNADCDYRIGALDEFDAIVE